MERTGLFQFEPPFLIKCSRSCGISGNSLKRQPGSDKASGIALFISESFSQLTMKRLYRFLYSSNRITITGKTPAEKKLTTGDIFGDERIRLF